MQTRTYRQISALFIFCLLAGMMLSLKQPDSAQAQGTSRTFPETGKTVRGRFLEYWAQNGGLSQQGFPISEEIQEASDTDGKIYTMQYFERAVFELHPDQAAPFDVQLSLLGVFFYNDRYYGSAPAQRTSTDNPRLFNETGYSVGGAFRRYWESRGGLAQQGYPISEEFDEVSTIDGKTYTVQYFERAVFEYHPEYAGTENEVLLSLLGVLYNGKKNSPTPQPTAVPPADNSGQYIFYDDAGGKMTVGKISSVGDYADQKSLTNASTGWTNIVGVGGGRVLWYNKASGLTVVGQVATDGTYTDTLISNTLGAGWTHMASAGSGLFIYFKEDTGTGGTARVNADGSISLLKVYTTFGIGLTHIVGLDNGIYFFYKRAGGATSPAATLTLSEDGSIINLQSFNMDNYWTNVVAGNGGTLLFYYYVDGRGLVVNINSGGAYTPIQRYPDAGGTGYPPLPISKPWLASSSNGTLLFYSDADRTGITGRLAGDGSVTIYNTYTGAFGKWSHIVGLK